MALFAVSALMRAEKQTDCGVRNSRVMNWLSGGGGGRGRGLLWTNPPSKVKPTSHSCSYLTAATAAAFFPGKHHQPLCRPAVVARLRPSTEAVHSSSHSATTFFRVEGQSWSDWTGCSDVEDLCSLNPKVFAPCVRPDTPPG